MSSTIVTHASQWPPLFTFFQKMDLKKPVEVRWGPPRRSNKQNRYLWGCVYKTLAEGLSELHKAHITSDQVHELCRKYFMPTVKVPGIEQDVPMSTTELCRSGNEDSFQDYVEQIQALAATKNIYIPDPNEVPIEAYA